MPLSSECVILNFVQAAHTPSRNTLAASATLVLLLNICGRKFKKFFHRLMCSFISLARKICFYFSFPYTNEIIRCFIFTYKHQVLFTHLSTPIPKFRMVKSNCFIGSSNFVRWDTINQTNIKF